MNRVDGYIVIVISKSHNQAPNFMYDVFWDLWLACPQKRWLLSVVEASVGGGFGILIAFRD